MVTITEINSSQDFGNPSWHQSITLVNQKVAAEVLRFYTTVVSDRQSVVFLATMCDVSTTYFPLLLRWYIRACLDEVQGRQGVLPQEQDFDLRKLHAFQRR